MDNVDNSCLQAVNQQLYTNYVNFPVNFQKDIRPPETIQPVFISQTPFHFRHAVDKLMKLCITATVFLLHSQERRVYPVYKPVETVENPVSQGINPPVIDKYSLS